MSKKIYIKAGHLKSVLQHCNDEDEIIVRVDEQCARDYAKAQRENWHPFQNLRIASIFVQASANARFTQPYAGGTLFIDAEWLKDESDKYVNKLLDRENREFIKIGGEQ